MRSRLSAVSAGFSEIKGSVDGNKITFQITRNIQKTQHGVHWDIKQYITTTLHISTERQLRFCHK